LKEGRVTRWGTILCASLPREVEALFVRHGGELPRTRIEQRKKKQTLQKAAAAASDSAASDAEKHKKQRERVEAEAARVAELERYPLKVFATNTSGPVSIQACGVLRRTLKEGRDFDLKLVRLDFNTIVFATSFPTALALQHAWHQAGKDRYLFEIDPSMFVPSSVRRADAPVATSCLQQQHGRTEEDAATLRGAAATSTLPGAAEQQQPTVVGGADAAANVSPPEALVPTFEELFNEPPPAAVIHPLSV